MAVSFYLPALVGGCTTASAREVVKAGGVKAARRRLICHTWRSPARWRWHLALPRVALPRADCPVSLQHQPVLGLGSRRAATGAARRIRARGAQNAENSKWLATRDRRPRRSRSPWARLDGCEIVAAQFAPERNQGCSYGQRHRLQWQRCQSRLRVSLRRIRRWRDLHEHRCHALAGQLRPSMDLQHEIITFSNSALINATDVVVQLKPPPHDWSSEGRDRRRRCCNEMGSRITLRCY
jgi:hypothetical protein